MVLGVLDAFRWFKMISGGFRWFLDGFWWFWVVLDGFRVFV